MEKNAMFTTIFGVVSSFQASLIADNNKKLHLASARQKADEIVNSFMAKKDIQGLCEFLTDAYQAGKKEGLFGYVKGNKVGSAAYLMQNSARMFHRSFNDLFKEKSIGWKMSGYNPFHAKEMEQTEKTPIEEVLATAKKQGFDNTCLADMELFMRQSIKRAEKRQAELDKLAKAEKLASDKQETERNTATLLAYAEKLNLDVEQVKEMLAKQA